MYLLKNFINIKRSNTSDRLCGHRNALLQTALSAAADSHKHSASVPGVDNYLACQLTGPAVTSTRASELQWWNAFPHRFGRQRSEARVSRSCFLLQQVECHLLPVSSCGLPCISTSQFLLHIWLSVLLIAASFQWLLCLNYSRTLSMSTGTFWDMRGYDFNKGPSEWHK